MLISPQPPRDHLRAAGRVALSARRLIRSFLKQATTRDAIWNMLDDQA